MHKLAALLAFGALILTGCYSAREDTVPGDLKKDTVEGDVALLQGKWDIVSAESNGEKWSDDDLKGPRDPVLVIKGSTISYRNSGQMKFTIDPTKKPKWMDMEGNWKIDPWKPAIYELEGDSLKICIVSGGSSDNPTPRPTEFKTAGQEFHTLFVCKRAKK
jgi:uncharacterized protein (TIGR03067 family)